MYSGSIFVEWAAAWNVNEKPRVHDTEGGQTNGISGDEGANQGARK